MSLAADRDHRHRRGACRHSPKRLTRYAAGGVVEMATSNQGGTPMAKERSTTTETQERSEAGQRGVAPREGAMRATPGGASPFALMRRFMEDLDGLLGGFGFGPGLM